MKVNFVCRNYDLNAILDKSVKVNHVRWIKVSIAIIIETAYIA